MVRLIDMKIIAVVPTYNRPNMLKRNLECLLAQTYELNKIVVVDNASEKETVEMLLSSGLMNNPKIFYIRLEINIGASGGFSTGMQKAMDMGSDWVWVMDDDAFPDASALASLLIYGRDTSLCYWSNCDKDTRYQDGLNIKKVKHMMFVGLLMHIDLLKRVGLPDHRFYMYYDDVEYSERIYKSGGEIFKVKNSYIDHDDWRTRGEKPFYKTRFLLWEVSIFNGDAFRLYYLVRNGFYIGNKSSIEKINYFFKQFLVLSKYLLFRREAVPFIGYAIRDILTGKRGRAIFKI